MTNREAIRAALTAFDKEPSVYSGWAHVTWEQVRSLLSALDEAEALWEAEHETAMRLGAERDKADADAAAWKRTAAGNREDAERLAKASADARVKHEAEIIGLRGRMVAAESELERVKPAWERQLAEAEARATTAEASYREAQVRIAGLEAERDCYRAGLVAMTAKRDRLFEEATAKGREVAEAREEIVRLKDDMDCGCVHGYSPDGGEVAQICTWHQDRATQQRVEELEAEVERLKGTNSQLNDLVAAYVGSTQKLKADLAEAQIAITTLTHGGCVHAVDDGSLLMRRDELDQLKDAVAERNAAWAEITRLKASVIAHQLNESASADSLSEKLKEIARLKARCEDLEHAKQASFTRAVELQNEVGRLKADLEREQIRLAACGVVALANTPDAAEVERLKAAEHCWPDTAQVKALKAELATVEMAHNAAREEIGQARRTAEHWKAEHRAANEEIARLKADMDQFAAQVVAAWRAREER